MEKKSNIFRRSLDELKSPRALVVTAMLIALNLAMDLLGLRIYITPELRVSVGFVCNASAGMLYGPVVGMMTGFCTDLLGFLLSPNNTAGYFPGYTITAVVGGLLYGLWLQGPPVGPALHRGKTLGQPGVQYRTQQPVERHRLSKGFLAAASRQAVQKPLPTTL